MDKMTLIINVFHSIVDDLVCLSKSKYTMKDKVRIFLLTTKMLIKRWALSKIIELKNEKFMNMNVNTFDYKMLLMFFSEVYVRGEYNFESKKLNPTIIDCGANIGISTLFFKWRFPLSYIVSIEPEPNTYLMLRKNIDENRLENIDTYQVALSKENKFIDFFIDEQTLGSPMMSIKFERMPKKRITVEAKKLSEIILDKEVDFLKMDIEGAETEVLQELHDSTKIKNIKEMTIEYHHKIGTEQSKFSDILRILESSGFEYQINARNVPYTSKERFQDVHIRAYRKAIT